MTHNYTIVEAPSNLGLSVGGVECLPSRLLELGLAKRIGARIAGRVETRPSKRIRDPETTILNADEIVAYTPRLADAVGAVIEDGEVPVILGGDCTILLGSMLALRRRGRYGLLFIDGHADFFQPEAEPNGEGASMDLAWVTGHGPRKVTRLEDFGPLVRSDDVALVAYRDHEDQAQAGSQPIAADILSLDLPKIRETGIEAIAHEAIKRVTRDELDGFFIHLDADVLDDAVMPAVDFRVPGGLSKLELLTLLRAAFDTGKVGGLEVTIYNPEKDESGDAGRLLADILAEALGGR